MKARRTAVSAPGKVLLTGGYLVLDRKYTGTVFSVDSRIHAIAQRPQKSDFPEIEIDDWHNIIIVESPQFLDARWVYEATNHPNGGGIVVERRSG